jgi:DNA-binding response OmpR family regulator
MGNRPRPTRPILIADDEPDIRDLLATVLQMHGYAVVEARDGVEAFNVARAHQPALILLDLMMPVMSGEEFRRAQLANADIKRIPVVVISAHHDVPRKARAMRAAAYLTKPLDLDELTATVSLLVRRS